MKRFQTRLQAQVVQETGDVRRRMLQAVAHELRTPLATLSAHLEILALDDDTSTEERRRYIRIAFAAARRLTELLNASRQFDALSISRAAFAPEPFQLVELAHDVAAKPNRPASLRGVTFRIEHPHDVPLIVGDVRLLERVFDLLLKDAARCAEPDGGVLVRLLPQRGAMRVEVHGSRAESSRTSSTVSKSGRQRAVHSSAHVALDVATVRKILELHGQTIDVPRARGNGVSFLFDLSLAPAERQMPSLLRSVTRLPAAST
jgi:two-component system, OmpR family, sensor histidine kinase BaeS